MISRSSLAYRLAHGVLPLTGSARAGAAMNDASVPAGITPPAATGSTGGAGASCAALAGVTFVAGSGRIGVTVASLSTGASKRASRLGISRAPQRCPAITQPVNRHAPSSLRVHVTCPWSSPRVNRSVTVPATPSSCVVHPWSAALLAICTAGRTLLALVSPPAHTVFLGTGKRLWQAMHRTVWPSFSVLSDSAGCTHCSAGVNVLVVISPAP